MNKPKFRFAIEERLLISDHSNKVRERASVFFEET